MFYVIWSNYNSIPRLIDRLIVGRQTTETMSIHELFLKICFYLVVGNIYNNIYIVGILITFVLRFV